MVLVLLHKVDRVIPLSAMTANSTSILLNCHVPFMMKSNLSTSVARTKNLYVIIALPKDTKNMILKTYRTNVRN